MLDLNKLCGLRGKQKSLYLPPEREYLLCPSSVWVESWMNDCLCARTFDIREDCASCRVHGKM